MEFNANKIDQLVKMALDCSKGSTKKYSVEEVDEAFADIMRKNFGGEEVNARTFRDHPEIFSVLEKLIDGIAEQTLESNPLFNLFTQTDTVNYGDSMKYDVEDDTDLIVSNTADGNLGIRRQKIGEKKSIDLQPEPHAIRVYDDWKRFMAGRITTTELTNKIAEVIKNARLNDIYALFAGLDSSITNVLSCTGDYDEEKLFEFIEKIQAHNNSQDVMIVTTKSMARKIGATDGSEQHKLDIYNQGYATYWNGTKTVVIPQRFKPGTTTFAIPDKVFIIPINHKKPIKQVIEGSTYMDTTKPTDHADMTIDVVGMLGWATGFICSGKIGVGNFTFK